MSKFIIDGDRASGLKQTFQYDAASDQYILQDTQDVTNLTEANKLSQNEDKARHGDGLGRRVASIPLIIWQDLYKRGITRDKKAFARWLNDSDNRLFRTDLSKI